MRRLRFEAPKGNLSKLRWEFRAAPNSTGKYVGETSSFYHTSIQSRKMRLMNVSEIFESMEYGPAPEDASEAQAWLKSHDKVFGQFIGSLGGTLGQLLVPVICGIALLRRHDTFGASVCLWWFGENFLDIAPYMADARAGELPLLGGNYGKSSPYGFHDWEFILGETGLLAWDKTGDPECYTHNWEDSATRQWLWDTANRPGREIELVMQHDQIAWRQLEKPHRRLHRIAREVHVGLGFEQQDLLGAEPSQQAVEDLLWSIIMLPEFQLVR